MLSYVHELAIYLLIIRLVLSATNAQSGIVL